MQPVLSIIPNPASTNVDVLYTFSKADKIQKCKIIISDLPGHAVREYEIENETGHLTVDISELPPATYFVTAKGADGWMECKKLVVIR